MDAAMLEERPCVCEVYTDCVRLSQQRGGGEEVYIQRINSSSSSSSSSNSSSSSGQLHLHVSAAAPPPSPDVERHSLGVFSCWGVFGVSLEPEGGHLLLVDGAERVGQIGDNQLLKVSSFRAIDLRIQRRQQETKQQQTPTIRTRLLRRPFRLRLGDAVGANVLLTELTVSSSSSSSSSEVEGGSSPYLPWVFEALTMGGFFFSLTMDLTLSLQQALQQAGSVSSSAAASTKAPEKETDGGSLMWNRLLLQPLQQHAQSLYVRAFQGYLGFGCLYSSSTSLLQLLLISRKDTSRLGVRFYSRGLDPNGSASNFVETEQLLLRYYHDHVPSYVSSSPAKDSSSRSSSRSTWSLEVESYLQIRGSIPLLWQQPPTLSWSPKPRLHSSEEESRAAASKHFSSLVARYGEVEAVNLIDKKGWQRTLGEAMETVILPLKKVRYTWFDFHAECRNMQWNRLGKLLQLLQPQLDKQGYLRMLLVPEDTPTAARGPMASPVPGWRVAEVYTQQKGVLRTNCVDCLDRTNVVQSVFARAALLKQLRDEVSRAAATLAAAAEAAEPFSPLTVSPSAEETFRALWTANADALSILYSGTPALKTDFTRTGKRSLWGALMDAKNSCCRYFLNNFADGFREDCLRLCTSPSLSLPRLPPKGQAGLAHVAAEYLLLLLFCFALSPFLLAIAWVHSVGAAATRLLLSLPLLLLRSSLLMPALFQSLPVLGWLADNPSNLLWPRKGDTQETPTAAHPLDKQIEACAFLGGCLLVLSAFLLGAGVYVHLRRHACVSLPLLHKQQHHQPTASAQRPPP